MHSNSNITEIIFPNGDKYSGEVKEGKMYGLGTLFLFNGDKYVGNFKDNKFHGQGTYSFSRTLHNFDTGEYFGTFKEGLRDGIGFMKFGKFSSFLNQDYESEVKYVGNEAYSEIENYHIYNDSYIGTFKDNVFSGENIKHGLDALSWDNHSVYAIGLWKDDQFLTPATKSYSTEINYPDYSEWDNFEGEEEQEVPPTKNEVKEEIQLQDNQAQHSMVEFSIPNMIEAEDVIPQLKQIPGLKITSHKPPTGYVFPTTGEDIEFEFKKYNFSAETYPDYYLWTFYVNRKCPQGILSKFISYLQKKNN